MKGRIKYAAYASPWLDGLSDLKPKTREGYNSLMRIHILPAFGDIAIGAIKTEHVRSFVGRLGKKLSPFRVRQAYRLFASSLSATTADGYINRNPCLGIRLPRIKRQSEPHFLTDDQIQVLARVTAEPFDTLIYVLAYTGLRWGEAAALRRKRVLLPQVPATIGHLVVAESMSTVGSTHHFDKPKSERSNRTVPFGRVLRTLLEKHLNRYPGDPDDLVFTSRGGQPLRHSNFYRRVFRPAVERAHEIDPWIPEDLDIHDLRRTCASLLIHNRAMPNQVQEWMGWSTIDLLDIYARLYPGSLEPLAERLAPAPEGGASEAGGHGVDTAVRASDLEGGEDSDLAGKMKSTPS
jgi:integrase